MRFQILEKNKEFEILFSEMLTLTHIPIHDSFSLNTRTMGDQSFYGQHRHKLFFTDVGRGFFGHNFFV